MISCGVILSRSWELKTLLTEKRIDLDPPQKNRPRKKLASPAGFLQLYYYYYYYYCYGLYDTRVNLHLIIVVVQLADLFRFSRQMCYRTATITARIIENTRVTIYKATHRHRWIRARLLTDRAQLFIFRDLNTTLCFL